MTRDSAGNQFAAQAGRLALMLLLAACARSAGAQAKSPARLAATGPWGISSSSSSWKNYSEWFPKLAAAGVGAVRLFPEWREIEPSAGNWQWERTDAMLKTAADNHLQINAILMGSEPTAKTSHAFPMDHLPEWSDYVAHVVGRYGNQIRNWEVWNEGNGGFNDGHHTTADYARLVAATYAAAKQADANAQIGLSVASFDAPYLRQTIRALSEQGKPDSFDFLCIHPYEIVDGLADADGEIPFLWMTRLLRAAVPERPDAEIWITEVARRIESRPERTVSEEDAAKALVKIYSMAIAQGIARVEWFEAQDPIGEDQGFGLLARDGNPRKAYGALKQLAAQLGAAPKFVGWLALGASDRGYGFVFQGASAAVLVAWMPAGLGDKTVSFSSDVDVRAAAGDDAARPLKAGQPLSLTDRPLLIVGLPPQLVRQAAANAGQSFPWGGNFSTAATVGGAPGAPDENQGVFQVGRAATPTIRFADGSTGILLRGDQGVGFYAHPSYASLQTSDYYVRVTVRRVAPGNVGMNLNYEVADSRGQAAYKNREIWFSASPSNDWQTHTWHVTDACFSKMWGYDFSFRPEQSVPFVIGKVEVSTQPLK
jgi:polysaccharide biosynthesis protein PslG